MKKSALDRLRPRIGLEKSQNRCVWYPIRTESEHQGGFSTGWGVLGSSHPRFCIVPVLTGQDHCTASPLLGRDSLHVVVLDGYAVGSKPVTRRASEKRRPSTGYVLTFALGSRSDLLQDGLGGSPIASPQLQEPSKRRRRVVLVVVVGVGEDDPALLEKAIHEVRPPQ